MLLESRAWTDNFVLRDGGSQGVRESGSQGVRESGRAVVCVFRLSERWLNLWCEFIASTVN